MKPIKKYRTCDNSRAARSSAILDPSCLANKATRRVTIRYEKNGTETDVLDLCSDCAAMIASNARKHGYFARCAP